MAENVSPAPGSQGATASPPAKKGGAGGMLIGVVLSAVLSGGAAFGGARIAGKSTHTEQPAIAVVKAPGPTVALEPFIANMADGEGHPHAIKITIAIELSHEAKEEEFKSFIPRIRDAVLGYLRSLPSEKLTDPLGLETVRKELLEKLHAVGAAAAEQVLVTDLISQ